MFKKNIPGTFVECGVWRGGSAGIMGLALKHSHPNRSLHLFDSFEGLPEPGPEDGIQAIEYSDNRGSGKLLTISKCVANLDIVKDFLLKKLHLDQRHIHFHVGWFQETIPIQAKKIGAIAVLRLDGDWYASTQGCLEYLYPLVSPGGAIILDDYYCWEGCKKATDEFRALHNITTPIVQIDKDCGYWIKDAQRD
jgi:O-methyltransferase